MADESYDEESFYREFNQAFHEKTPDYDANLNIALVGKVSSGKSSLLNAILERPRSEPFAAVGANSGTTKEVILYHLDDNVLIVDCPGLDDVRAVNSDITRTFLSYIDLGIFVVTGSADGSQRSNYEDLKASASEIIVVLNKIDEWDHLERVAIERVVQQWRDALGADKIFLTCAKGYDPDARQSEPMDLRGIDSLQKGIFDFLDKQKKTILLMKHLRDKNKHALRIIGSALVVVAGEAFIPGSAIYITATQVAAVLALMYLYTGEIVSPKSILAIFPALIGESIGSNAFLWCKSFLPPTGIVDAAAATVAVTVTFGVLCAVKWMLENGYPLTETGKFKMAFGLFMAAAAELKGISLSELKDVKTLLALIFRIIQRVVVPR